MSADRIYVPNSFELLAAASVIEQRCADKNITYMECKTTSEHPKECLYLAHDVQNCVIDSLDATKTKCPVEFNAFVKCLDKNNSRFEDCRQVQKNFKLCWEKKTVSEGEKL